jgi:hypothetical protein
LKAEVEVAMRRGWLEVLHVAALAFWLGAVVMTGVAAAVIFPTVRGLDPALPEYAGYQGEHWMLLAGKVANNVFIGAAIVQVICACLVVASMIGLTVWERIPRWVIAARWVSVVLVLACLGFNMVVLRPRMSRNLAAYWQHAAAGHNEEANAFRTAFDADHPTATRTFGVTAAMLFLSIGIAGWSWGRTREGGTVGA